MNTRAWVQQLRSDVDMLMSRLGVDQDSTTIHRVFEDLIYITSPVFRHKPKEERRKILERMSVNVCGTSAEDWFVLRRYFGVTTSPLFLSDAMEIYRADISKDKLPVFEQGLCRLRSHDLSRTAQIPVSI